MRSILILFAILSFSYDLKAQKITATVSNEIEKAEKTDDLIKVGDKYYGLNFDRQRSSRGLWIKLSKDKYSISIKKFDNAMQLENQTDLQGGEKIFGLYNSFLYTIKGRLYLIYCKTENDIIKIFSSEINFSTLELENTKELLTSESSSEGFTMGSIEDYEIEDKIQVIKSQDENKLLIFWNMQYKKRFLFAVTDNKFSVIRSGTEKIEEGKDLSIINSTINNEGNVFVSFIYQKKDENIAKVYANTKANRSYYMDIADENIEVEQAFVTSTSSRSIIVTGTYKEGSANIKGVFYTSFLDEETQAPVLKKTMIPNDLVEKLSDIGFAKTKEKKYGINKIKLQPFSLSDGTVALVGQFEDITYGERATFRFFGNILTVYLDEKSAVFSMAPKLRVSAGQLVGSECYPVVFKDKIVVLYNDNIKNVQRNIDESPKRYDKYNDFSLIAAIFERDGTVKREVLIDQSSDNFLAVTERVQQLSPFSFQIPFVEIGSIGQVKKSQKLASVVLN